jgi:hypothetical protein
MSFAPLPINYGKDHNFFQRLTVNWSSFNTLPDVIIPIMGNPSFSFVNEGTNPVEYSYNGNTKHGDLVPNTPSAAISFNHRGQSQIWFRVLDGYTTVRVEAFTEGEFGGLNGGAVSGGGSGGSTVAQGTAAGLSGAWPVEITDGTNGPAAVKSASTPAAATDPSLVVQVSPNNTPISVVNKPLASATYSPTLYTGFTTVSGNIKGSAGNVFSLQATNRSTSVYLQLFNTASAPSGGATPYMQFLVTSEIIVGTDFFTTAGLNFSTGISFGFSTTNGSYTAATAANVDLMATYI